MDYILHMIEEMGFFGYIQKYPVNPITIVGGLVIIGIFALSIHANVKKRTANQFLAKNPGSAVMTFHKKKIGNNDYADNIRIVKLNGEDPYWFFVKTAIPAIYLKQGENQIELYADWARGSGVSIKMFQSEVVLITVVAEAEGHYSLEYCIPANTYIFEPFVFP
jgi:hypothetical protein